MPERWRRAKAVHNKCEALMQCVRYLSRSLGILAVFNAAEAVCGYPTNETLLKYFVAVLRRAQKLYLCQQPIDKIRNVIPHARMQRIIDGSTLTNTHRSSTARTRNCRCGVYKKNVVPVPATQQQGWRRCTTHPSPVGHRQNTHAIVH